MKAPSVRPCGQPGPGITCRIGLNLLETGRKTGFRDVKKPVMNPFAATRTRIPAPHRARAGLEPVIGLLLLGLLSCACSGKRPPSMVIILVDTLRADRLGLRPGERCTAPGIRKELADKGTAFLDVQAASPWTTPSVAAVVTGRYPDEEGIHDLRDPLPGDALTLAERLRGEGQVFATGTDRADLERCFPEAGRFSIREGGRLAREE